MVIYHAGFDLTARDLVPFDVTRDLGWVVFARLTAGTFLMLVGWSLVLATQNGFRPQPYLRRLGIIVAAAMLVSAATWWMQPSTFVFFGILHEIAVASVLALPFLWAPSLVTAAVAAIVIAVPFFYASPIFDWPPLWWVGLSATQPESVDYVPVFPWFGVVLAGLVLGRLFVAHALDTPFARWRPTERFSAAMVWLGRWSLGHLPGPPTDPLRGAMGGKPGADAQPDRARAQLHGSVQPGLPPAGPRRGDLQRLLRLHVHQS